METSEFSEPWTPCAQGTTAAENPPPRWNDEKTKDPTGMSDGVEGKAAPIKTSRKIYRPPLTSLYRDPDYLPDSADSLDVVLGEHGKSLWKDKEPLPPRTEWIKFEPEDKKELDRNAKWGGCPSNLRPAVEEILREFWDVFAERGLCHAIRGFQFHVDTGEAKPISCRRPRYGPFEASVILRLCQKLKDNNMVDTDTGPWGSLIVLAAKPGQEDIPWWEFIWRLCVSYRKVNQLTRPFTFPFRRCNDAVLYLGRARYRISLDLDCGYWQVPVEQRSRPKLAFFTPEEKLHWKKMPMGAENSAPVFAAMMVVMQREWDAKAAKRKPPIKDCASEVIINDIMLHGLTAAMLLLYFRCVLEVLMHYRATIKLKKCQFFDPQQEFVGIDVLDDGNAPASSKNKAFKGLVRPKTFSDLRMLIGMFGFYTMWIPWFEPRINPWWDILKEAPKAGSGSEGQRTPLGDLWKDAEHDPILADLKTEILKGPVLA